MTSVLQVRLQVLKIFFQKYVCSQSFSSLSQNMYVPVCLTSLFIAVSLFHGHIYAFTPITLLGCYCIQPYMSVFAEGYFSRYHTCVSLPVFIEWYIYKDANQAMQKVGYRLLNL